MTRDQPTFTRRRLLRSVGAAGFVTAGAGLGLRTLDGRRPPYTRYTYAATQDTGDRRVRVAWYETYNGEFQEAQNGSSETNATLVLDADADPAYVEEASGPAITLSNLLPGDSGTLVVGLLAEEITESDGGVDVWLRATLTEDCENGVNEPESLATGEDDPMGETDCAEEAGIGTGELGDALEVALWRDDGLAGVGACDGRLGVGETPFVEGPLSTVTTGTDLATGRRVGGCLDQGATQCIGFAWELPAVSPNDLQSDSVAFDLSFVGVPCDSGNPFEDGGPR